MLALANGADTEKMKYGHRGANHPVKDLKTGRVYISSQNHGYVVDMDKMNPEVAEASFVNVNDGTSEGIMHSELPVMSVQFHPEASPGPVETVWLFERFLELIGR